MQGRGCGCPGQGLLLGSGMAPELLPSPWPHSEDSSPRVAEPTCHEQTKCPEGALSCSQPPQCRVLFPTAPHSSPPGIPAGSCGKLWSGAASFPPLCSLQPGPGQSRGCHGFHRAHDPAHLPHAASRDRADPLQNGLAFFHVIPSIPTLPLPGAAEERPGAGNCPLSARPPPLERHGEAQGTLQQ